MSYLLKRTLLALLLTLVPVAVFGQAISGDLVGVVKDSSGAVVANAQVDATNLSTSYKITTMTNAAGEFHFINLPVGHYSLQAATGGMKGGYADIEVELNKTATANISTSVAGSATTKIGRAHV